MREKRRIIRFLSDEASRRDQTLRLLASRAGTLAPKAMDVLVRLAEAAPNPVTRDDLITAVWGERYVSDEVLTHALIVGENDKIFREDDLPFEFPSAMQQHQPPQQQSSLN